MKLVMLGKLRSGKSTVTKILQELIKEHYNVELKQKPLATPIYDEAKDFYKRHELVWRKNRRLLEGIGGAFNEDFPGGDKIILLYDKVFDPNEDIVVEDCRRITQADYFKEKGAVLIRIVAERGIRKSRCQVGEWAEGHITDDELDNYPVDFEIVNNGNDINDLRAMLLNEIVLKLNRRSAAPLLQEESG